MINPNKKITLATFKSFLKGPGRNSFTYFKESDIEGIEVYNSCGCSMVGRKVTPGI